MVMASTEIIVPMFRGSPLTYIPFVFGPTTITPNIGSRRSSDLVEVNLSHYRSSAISTWDGTSADCRPHGLPDFQRRRSFKIIRRGVGRHHPTARAGMLEFTGQGLQPLSARQSKEKLMAVLGARLLEEQKKAVESYDTLSTRLAGEQSVLRSLAGTVSTGLSKLLEWAALWQGVTPEEAKTVTARLKPISSKHR